MRWVVVLLALAGCDKVLLGPERISIDAPSSSDISKLMFGSPMPIAGANTAADEDRPSLTDDLLELYFHRGKELFVARRASVDHEFGTAQALVELNDGYADVRACISGDGLRIHFSRQPLATDDYDIYLSQRLTRSDTWSPPQRVPELSTGRTDYCGGEREDGFAIYGSSDTALALLETWISKRTSRTEPWGPREPLTDLNTADHEGAPWSTGDAQILVFDRRPQARIYQATQQGTSYAVRVLSELAATGSNSSPWISSDGRMIVYSVGDSFGELYMATR